MDIISLVFFFLIIVPSSIIHEYSHGWMAYMLGDPTAKYAGRLTLNPLAHIDKWGTIYLPIILYLVSGGSFIFAYAKPVPFNPYNLKDQKWGTALVGVAGPISNLVVAGIFAMFIRIMGSGATPWLTLTGAPFVSVLSTFFAIIVYANILLAVFNLVPIPPLDGSKILFAVLPDRFYKIKFFLEKNGFFILLFFIFFAFQIIQPIISGIFKLMVG
ncbi:MAG: site-2 protease family protein [Candidatus Magasanikbacteria bacterium]|nr:site-2 protease family protein [Candidatus Magasanikbacteria bacterium]